MIVTLHNFKNKLFAHWYNILLSLPFPPEGTPHHLGQGSRGGYLGPRSTGTCRQSFWTLTLFKTPKFLKMIPCIRLGRILETLFKTERKLFYTKDISYERAWKNLYLKYRILKKWTLFKTIYRKNYTLSKTNGFENTTLTGGTSLYSKKSVAHF